MEYIEHIIQGGETWESIAEIHGLTVEIILAANNISYEDDYYWVVYYGNGYGIIRIPVISNLNAAIITMDNIGVSLIEVTPENTGFLDNTSIPAELLELETETSSWVSFEVIRILNSSTDIVGYNTAQDAYQFRDGSRRSRSDLLNEVRNLISLPSFDPSQATDEWLNAIGGRFDAREISAEQKLREKLLVSLFALSTYVGDFEDLNVDLDTFLSFFNDLSTEELAQWSLETSMRAQEYWLTTDKQLDEMFAAELDELGLTGANNFVNWSLIPDTLFLAEGYLSSINLDELRQIIRSWVPQYEARLLIILQGEIDKMPLNPVWGIPCVHIRGLFQSFHSKMQQRHDWLSQQKLFVDEYERERQERLAEEQFYQDTSLPWWVELGFGIFSEANPLLKGVDIALSLRDLLLYQDPLALLGILPMVPRFSAFRWGRFPTNRINIPRIQLQGNAIDMLRRRNLINSLLEMMQGNEVAPVLRQLSLDELNNLYNVSQYSQEANEVYNILRGPLNLQNRRINTTLFPITANRRTTTTIPITVAVTYIAETMVISLSNILHPNIISSNEELYGHMREAFNILKENYPNAIVIAPEILPPKSLNNELLSATGWVGHPGHAEATLYRAFQQGRLEGIYNENSIEVVSEQLIGIGISNLKGTCTECHAWLNTLRHTPQYIEVGWFGRDGNLYFDRFR